jgi:hypothetical protein
MKSLPLTWVVLVIAVIQVSLGQIRNNADLGLLVETGGEIGIQATVRSNRLSLRFNLSLTKDDIAKTFSHARTIAKEFTELECIKDSMYKNRLKPAAAEYRKASQYLSHCNTFRDENGKNLVPESSCLFEPTAFTREDLEEMEAVKADFANILTTWVKDDLKDLSKLNVVKIFIDSYVGTARRWFDILKTELSQLDELRAGEFPASLRGEIERAVCLDAVEHESISVLEYSYGKDGFGVEIEFRFPKSLVNYQLLQPIWYNGVSLEGKEQGIIYTRDLDNTKLLKFLCNKEDLEKSLEIPLCQIETDSDSCTKALFTNHIDNAILNCEFIYSTSPEIIYLDTGTLVQHPDAKVIVDKKPLYPLVSSPFLITSNLEVIITINEVTYEIAPNAKKTPLVRSTMLTSLQLFNLQSKIVWIKIKDVELWDIVLLVLDITLFVVAVLFSLFVRRCKRQKGRDNNRRSRIEENKRTRKDNYTQNRKLLKSGAL